MHLFNQGQDLMVSFTITQADGKTPELHSNIVDVRAFVFVGKTQVAKFAKVNTAEYEDLDQETEEGTYTIKVPGAQSKDWKVNESITIEVHQFINDAGTTRKLTYTAVAYDKIVAVNTKTESIA